jgi:hypothetical protein
MSLIDDFHAWSAADMAARNAEAKMGRAVESQINNQGDGPSQTLYMAAARLRLIASERLSRMQRTSEGRRIDHSAPGELVE